jgi:hypothetical protein
MINEPWLLLLHVRIITPKSWYKKVEGKETWEYIERSKYKNWEGQTVNFKKYRNEEAPPFPLL